jgi:8-oxo-dGTP diphosphatase
MKQYVDKTQIIVSAGLISRDGKYLINKRPEGCHLAGYWEFPGGKQEKGETLEECLKREIKEELGLEIDIEQEILSVHHEYETKEVTLHFFVCTPFKENPQAREGQEISWVHPDELNKYKFPPPDLDVIKFITSQTATLEKV